MTFHLLVSSSLHVQNVSIFIIPLPVAYINGCFSTCYFFLIGPTDVNLVEETNDKRKTQVFFTNPMIKVHDSDASSDVIDPPRQSWLHNHGVHESNPSEYISNYPEPDYC